MCGVVGISGTSSVNLRLYDALTVLQHRGQDAAGIVTDSEGELHVCKNVGLARDVFRSEHMARLSAISGLAMFAIPPQAVPARLWPSPFMSTRPMVSVLHTMAI